MAPCLLLFCRAALLSWPTPLPAPLELYASVMRRAAFGALNVHRQISSFRRRADRQKRAESAASDHRAHPGVVRVLLEQVDLVTGERAAALIQVLYSGGHLSHPPDC